MLSKADKFRLFEVISGGRPSGCESVEYNTYGYSVQATLFPVHQERLVIFCPLPGVSEEDFVSVLTVTKPAYVIDLRPVPRFDIGQLNRQAVFGLFRQEQSTYIDTGEFSQEKTLSSEWQVPAAALLKQNARGPLMFLMSGQQNNGKIREAIFEELDSANGVWNVYDMPQPLSGRMELCRASG